MAELAKRDWPCLEYLVLNANRIGVQGVNWIVQAKMPVLTYLHLSNNNIEQEGCKLIFEKAQWPHLAELGLNNAITGDEAVKYISRFNFPELKTVCLTHNLLTSRSVEYLGSSGYNLKRLYLSSNRIEDEGAKKAITMMKQGMVLQLSGNRIKDIQTLKTMKSRGVQLIL